MPILAQNAGAAVKVLSVSHYPRVAGKSKYGIRNRLWRGIYDLLMVRWLMKRQVTTFASETIVQLEFPAENSSSPSGIDAPGLSPHGSRAGNRGDGDPGHVANPATVV